jgi:F-type H+-transporting ATPase subunit c
MFDPMLAAAATDVATTATEAVKAAGIGGSIHIGLAGLGSAIGVGLIGMKAAEATGRNPGAAGAIRNQAILFAALSEAIIFFAIFLAPK